MKINDLSTKLKNLDIPNCWYLIGDKGITDNKTVIRLDDYNTWSVYYSERGVRHGEKTFNSESEACEELFNRMKAKKKLFEKNS